LENEADRVTREAVASLFNNGIDPMVVIRWKDIFESLEAAVDACETAANVLEGRLALNELRLGDALAELDTALVDADPSLLVNVNRPADLAAIRP